MGLDIMAYRGLNKIADDFEGDDPGYSFHVKPGIMHWIERKWRGRTEGLEAGALYDYADNMGVLSITYSGYGTWRAELRRRVRHILGRGSGAFRKLIEFPDNEGYIGTVVAAKLARDFAEHHRDILHSSTVEFMERYAKLHQGFEMAADGGAVEFH